MSKVDLIATGRLPYGTKVFKSGETFSAGSTDAGVLVAIGKAKRAPPKAEPKQAKAKPELAKEKEKPDERHYKRRDMEAE